jgi:hypothetical protein
MPSAHTIQYIAIPRASVRGGDCTCAPTMKDAQHIPAATRLTRRFCRRYVGPISVCRISTRFVSGPRPPGTGVR